MPIEERIHDYFLHSKETLAFAESCTGGLLSYQITKIPGASSYFLGSFVTYSNQLKESVLGVSQKTLKEHGAFSAATVYEMALGAFQKSGASWVIAVSGVMGPSGAKEVGTVYYAIFHQGKEVELGLLPKKNGLERKNLMEETSITLLEYLWRLIQDRVKILP